MCICLSAVEEHLTPAAEHRRREGGNTVLVAELGYIVLGIVVSVLHGCTDACKAVYAFVHDMVLGVLSLHGAFLHGVGLSALVEGVVVARWGNLEYEILSAGCIVGRLGVREIDIKAGGHGVGELRFDEGGVAHIGWIALVEIEQRVGRIDFAPSAAIAVVH